MFVAFSPVYIQGMCGNMEAFKKIVFDLFIAVLMVATGTINTLAAK